MNYRIAKISLEEQVAVKKGKKALDFCKANYRENKLFTRDDLTKLENK